MPLLTMSQARTKHSLSHVASSRAIPPGWVSASSSEFLQEPSLEGGVNCIDSAFGGRTSSLAAGK